MYSCYICLFDVIRKQKKSDLALGINVTVVVVASMGLERRRHCLQCRRTDGLYTHGVFNGAGSADKRMIALLLEDLYIIYYIYLADVPEGFLITTRRGKVSPRGIGRFHDAQT